jgi:hypothetical protein
VREKRLFLISILIVEMVLLYVVWRPSRDRSMRRPHRIAAAPAVVRLPEMKPPAVVIASRKPVKVPRSNVPAAGRPPMVNASLKVPEPIAGAPVSVLVPQTPSIGAESFWCHLERIGSNCDCEVRSDERASNRLQ